MSIKPENPYQRLKRIFHEPSRLAILSLLCSTANGVSFNELKKECQLTDGNLSRHLKTLEDARIIRVEKRFMGNRPRTTIFLTDEGRQSFVEYLNALEEVLRKAETSLTARKKRKILRVPGINPVKA